MARRINLQKFAREMMGRQVRFSKWFKRVTVYPEYRCDNAGRQVPPTKTWEVRELSELNFHERVGWVVGVRFLQTGVRIEGTSGYGHFDEAYDGDPPTFKETGPRKLAIVVVEEPTSRPLFVPMDAIELLTEYRPPQYVSEHWRKVMSQDSVGWPRDPKTGRFVRG